MNAGDMVMVKQLDHGFFHTDASMSKGGPPSTDAAPMVMWIYALVLDVLAGGAALVEVAHPANIEHGTRKVVPRVEIRTLEDIQALHDAHPERNKEKLDFGRLDHKELNNFRVAIERLTAAAEAAG